jgi:hypothetical protein
VQPPAGCSRCSTACSPEEKIAIAELRDARRAADLDGVQSEACCLTYDALKPFTHDAGAERASSSRHHAFCDSRPVLRAESSCCLDNGACGGTEPINESPVVGRSVIGTFGASGGNRNWAYSNRANIGPELVLVLHLLLHTPTRSQKTAPTVRQLQHHNPYWAAPLRWAYAHPAHTILTCPETAHHRPSTLHPWWT